ncbi:MAG: hypothetical protein ABW079_06685 [Sedimenticola sp.]
MSEGKRISTTQLAKRFNIPTKHMFGKLQECGLIERVGDEWSLTKEGKACGGVYKESKKIGRYVTWPDDFSIEGATDNSEMISATALGGIFSLPARRINQILSEHGWIKKHLKGWIVTPLGQSVGGEQRESNKTGIPYALWPKSVIDNESLKLTLTEIKGDHVSPSTDHMPSADKSSDFRTKLAPKLRTADGHVVRSRAEMLIDNWLYTSEIVHAYERRLPIEEEVYCDFYLPSGKVYIEFWGMESNSKYAERKNKKRQIYEQYGFKLIELNDKDIANLDDILPKQLLKYDITIY